MTEYDVQTYASLHVVCNAIGTESGENIAAICKTSPVGNRVGYCLWRMSIMNNYNSRLCHGNRSNCQRQINQQN